MKPLIDHHFGAHAPLRKAATEWRRAERLPPVLLLTGPSGIGKRESATYLARWILCERAGFSRPVAEESGPDLFGGAPGAPPAAAEATDGPCDECPACKRALAGSWTDFVEVRAENDAADEEAASGPLKIEQFRSLKASAGFSAREGSYRVHLISDADRMTVQAANSILKLLEEPPQGWIFLLTASDATLLLPTIVSRAQALRLRPLPDDAVSEILRCQGAREDRIPAAVFLANGSFRRAEAFASDDTWERRQAVFEFIKEPATQLNALVDWAGASPGALRLLVDLLEALVADLVRWSLTEPAVAPAAYPWQQRDARAALLAQADQRLKASGSPAAARAFWLARAERLAETRALALTPVNRKLLVQELLIPWLPGGRRP